MSFSASAIRHSRTIITKIYNNITDSLPLIITPNPFTDHLHIDLLLNRPAFLKIEVCNIFGQQMDLIANHNVKDGEQNFLLNTNSLPKGIYFVKVVTGDERFVKRVVKIE